MSRVIEAPIQRLLSDIVEQRNKVSLIPEGTMVYPEHAKRGVVQNTFYANRLGKKIEGLTGFVARGPFTTYLDGNYTSFSKGTRFGMHVKNERVRELPR